MSNNSITDNNLLSPIESCKEAHKKFLCLGDFDLYALSKNVNYYDRTAPTELISLAAKRVAFRLKYPNGSIEMADPVQMEGYSIISVNIYVPSAEDSSCRICIGSGRGYFSDPGFDCVNIYKAQDRALRNALHNAGFQGITEGSEVAGEGASNVDLVEEENSKQGSHSQLAADQSILTMPSVSEETSRKIKKGGKESKEAPPASVSAEQTDGTPGAIIPGHIMTALETKVSYQGIRGTVGELLRSKQNFVRFLSEQYTTNRDYHNPKEEEMFNACNVVITAMDNDPALSAALVN